MTQTEYLSRLETLLEGVPTEKKWEILDDIRRHFDEGIEQGIPEEELSHSLGAPELLAREYQSLYAEGAVIAATDLPSLPRPAARQRPPRQPAQSPGVMGSIARGIGLFFVNICVALPVFITLYALYFSLWITGVAMALAGVLSSILVAVNHVIPLWFIMVDYPLLMFFIGITVSALGGMILLSIGGVGRGLLAWTRRYGSWNQRVMRGGDR